MAVIIFSQVNLNSHSSKKEGLRSVPYDHWAGTIWNMLWDVLLIVLAEAVSTENNPH